MADGDYLFQRVSRAATRAGVNKLTPQEAREWFRNMALNVNQASPTQIQAAAQPFQNIVNLSANSVGKLYFFNYYAKYHDKLKYYDRYPMIFPIEFYSDSMLGINLHYLPPYLRARLMDSLYETITNQKYDKTTKLVISYRILNAAARYRYFKPCVKKYLFSNVRSTFQYIKPELWDYGILLPLARWEKGNDEQVWADSVDKIGW